MAPKFEVRAKDRIRKGLVKYVGILQQAAQRGIVEADTSNIVQAMLVELLGYAQFQEVTAQFAVQGKWADWAVTVDGNLLYFVEVKPLGARLREKDLFQVTSYSRQYSLEWAVLSTGDVWQCYRVTQGREAEEVLSVRVLDADQPIDEKVERFYMLAKEGFSRGILREYCEKAECFRAERLARIMLSDEVLAVARRALHKEMPGRRVDVGELRAAIARGVIRGDLGDYLPKADKAPRRSPRSVKGEAGSGKGPEGNSDSPGSAVGRTDANESGSAS